MTALTIRLGVAIKRNRQRLKITQGALAESAGVTQGFISQLEQGLAKQNVNIVNLEKMAACMDLKLSELIAWAEDLTMETAMTNAKALLDD